MLRSVEPATRRATQALSLIRSILRRMLAGGSPIRTEWDNDVPPFPIFVGELAQAEATLTIEARRNRRLVR
jgi:hypothetical protein